MTRHDDVMTATSRLLLEHPGAPVDARDNSGGRTPLLVAARARQEAAARILLEYGAQTSLRCGKATVGEVLGEMLPGLRVDRVVVRERPVENTVETLARLLERRGGGEEERRDLAVFKGVLAFLGAEEVGRWAVWEVAR